MRFKQFISSRLEENFSPAGIKSGQAEDAHHPTGEASSSIDNPHLRSKINFELVGEMSREYKSPQVGFESIRKVLHIHGLTMPVDYQIDPEGDEIVVELDQYGDVTGYSVYIIYSLSEKGVYEFYAEIGDDDQMEDLLTDALE